VADQNGHHLQIAVLDFERSFNYYPDMGRPSDARKKLLDAALMLVWERSVGGVTVDMICRRAGVLPGTFYHFFKSRSELVAAALRAHWEAFRPEVQQAFDPEVPPLRRIHNYCEFVRRQVERRKREVGRVLGCPYTSVGSEVGKQDVVISEAVQEILADHRKFFHDALWDAAAAGEIEVSDIAATVKLLLMQYCGALTAARIHDDASLVRGLPEVTDRLLGFDPSKREAVE
jgi:TetR/AcrR family transcriptional repressor of nem operon